ncbi:dipeptide ABC transporter ATP-binding protein [Streptomyces sp. V4-01]|uniref:Dipeptide ABC transporter ATP-binding protein n=1 Tax=Actinacidiphila polyblastidii TaxID=3110430 RepID=A0ABU7PAF9_9ACTN|nr:dipeptide ABC transporter ATP-binding protein [Streptomyces sp. V4-01]
MRDLRVEFAARGGGRRAAAVPAVRGVDLDLARGEVLGLVGESGSGKSVTALALTGLLGADARVSGSVLLGGTQVVGASDGAMARLRGSRISMVFQDSLSAFTPVYRIGDQIAETVRAHRGLSRRQARDRAVELLDLVGIPEPRLRADAYPHEFSGGMRQRAMIAAAIANDPDLILADEPTTALDVTIQAQVLDVLRTARRETGAALLFVSHDLGVVAGFADRVAVMYAGRVVETAPVDELFARPRMPYTLGLIGAVPRLDAPDGAATGTAGSAGGTGVAALVPIPGSPPPMAALAGGCPFAARCPLTRDACRDAEPALAPLPAGPGGGPAAAAPAPGPDSPGGGPHLVACVRAGETAGLAPQDVFPVPALPPAPGTARPRAERAPILHVEGLVRTFRLTKGTVVKRTVGAVYAADGVDLDIREGETLGLVGESGSGKSTTLFELFRDGGPEEGTVTLLGEPLGGAARGGGRRAVREARGRVQIVFQDPTGSLDPRMTIADIIAEPMRARRMPREEIEARVPRLLRQVGLEEAHAGRFPHEFSGGQRQRIGIARAVSTSPRLVVLDEPVSALDVSVQAGVLNLLQRLKAEMGLAYLFVSHDLSVVRHVADRVSVMYLGRTVEAGDVASVFARPRHPYTQALLSAVPIPDPARERARTRILLAGDPPSPTRRHTGCRFRARCPLLPSLDAGQRARCAEQVPALAPHGPDHVAACHWARERPVV